MRRRAVALGALALVGVTALGARAAEGHADGWGWSRSPAPAPPRIRFEGRDYDRGGEERDGVPAGWVVRGETPGGGRILSSPTGAGTSTLLYVEDGHHVYAYGLVGGP